MLDRLTQELAVLGADSILKTLADLPSRKKEAVVQDDTCASTAPKLVSNDGHISFDESATVIFRVRQLARTYFIASYSLIMLYIPTYWFTSDGRQ